MYCKLGKKIGVRFQDETGKKHVIMSNFSSGVPKKKHQHEFCLGTWILIELLPPHHVFRNGSFWQAFFPCLPSFHHPEGCCSHGSASQEFTKKQKLYRLKSKKLDYVYTVYTYQISHIFLMAVMHQARRP